LAAAQLQGLPALRVLLRPLLCQFSILPRSLLQQDLLLLVVVVLKCFQLGV